MAYAMKRQKSDQRHQSKMAHNGSLEVLEAGIQEPEPTSSSLSRPSSSKKAPPIHGARHSVNSVNGVALPTVEKSLVSVKRKEPQRELRVDMDSLQLDDDDGDDIVAMARLDGGSALTATASTSFGASSSKPDKSKSLTSKSDSDSDDSSEDESTRKAPNQLIMEFLQCVMSNDLENGLKLCKMILLYEPNNRRALEFLPVLQEKMEQDEAKKLRGDDSEDSDSSDDDDEEEDDEEEDDEDDEEDDSSDSDSSSDEDDGNEIDDSSLSCRVLGAGDNDTTLHL